MFIRIAAALILAVLPAVACMADDKVVLRKEPVSAVGDKATVVQAALIQSRLTDAKGQVWQDNDFAKELDMTLEVLKADDKGQATEIRVKILSASQSVISTKPKNMAYAKSIRLGNITFLARRADGVFTIDTNTIASTTMKKLSDAEVYFLKRIFQDVRESQRRADRLLLSDKPVAVGDTWTLTNEDLEAWSAINNASGRISGKATSATMAFQKLQAGVATVSGRVELRIPLEGPEVRPLYQVTLRIDTATGRILAKSTRYTVSSVHDRMTGSTKGQGQETVIYKPGDGTSTSAPANVFRLGWPTVPDTNAFRDTTRGVSLSPPAGFTLQKAVPAGSDIMRALGSWKGPRDASIHVNESDNLGLRSMQQWLPVVQANIRKSANNYEAIEASQLTLPDNVPAAIITGKCNDGKVFLLNLIAIDGQRVISVTASVSAADGAAIEAVTKAAMSLRVTTVR